MDFLMQISTFIANLIGIYSFIIVIDIFLTWVPVKNGIVHFIDSITRPFLNLFKGIKSLRAGRFDFSPIIALIVLNIFQSIFAIFGQYGKVTIGMIIAVVLKTFWSSFISFLLFLFIVVLIIRLALIYSKSPKRNYYIELIDKMIDAPICRIQKIFFRKRLVNDKTIVTFSLILSIVIYFVLKIGINLLVNWLLV